MLTGGIEPPKCNKTQTPSVCFQVHLILNRLRQATQTVKRHLKP